MLPADVDLDRLWADLPERGRHVGSIAVSDVEFDETRRQSISAAAFDHLRRDPD